MVSSWDLSVLANFKLSQEKFAYKIYDMHMNNITIHLCLAVTDINK